MKKNQSSDNTNIQRGNRMNESGFPRMKPLAAAVSGIVLGGMAMNVHALPSTPEVVSGSATVTRPDVSTMQINQASSKVILNYQEFGIAASELVNFVQPGADSVALNRVLGGNPSLILGRLTANGQVFLLNEQGVVFGSGAQVNVGGLVAGTMDVADQNFLDGSYQFSLDGATGSVLNAGNITAGDGGYVVLLGSDVANTGVIAARMGSAALLSGENVSLDFGGDGLLSYSVDGGVVDSLVENGGLISADGGLVVMAGQTAGDLQATVVNNEGVVQATGLIERNGKVVLASNATILNSGLISVSSTDGGGGSVAVDGARVGQLGDVNADGESGGGSISLRADEAIAFGAGSTTTANAGAAGDGGEIVAFTEGEALFRRGAEIEATGGADSGDGGFVEVSGLDYVEINGRVDTSAPNGVSGTFLIDPTDITISGSASTSGMTTVSGTFQSDGSTGSSVILDDDLLALLDTTNVIVTTQTGAEALTAPSGADIIVGFDAVLDASILGNAANNSLTLQAGEDIQVIGSINMDGGELILQAGVRTDIDTGSIITVGSVTAEKVTAFADSLISLGNLSANSVDLTINQTGPISVTNDKTLAATANTASGVGDITINTTTGDINVEAIDAGVRTVTLNAAGAIDAAADNAGAELTAGTLSLTAATGIGAGANSFDIENVNSASAVTDDGNIAIDIIGGTGTLSFTSIDNQGASTDTVTIDQQGTQALSITTVSTADGDINLSSANANISVSTASAGNNQNVNIVTTGSAANVSVGSVTGNVVTITATGAIQELGADGTVDISATQAALTGAAGIGAAGAIETDIDTLAATASGDIMLSNSGALDINTVGALSGVSTTTTGDVSITNDSGVTLTEDISSAAAVTLTASAGNISLAADDGTDDVTGTTVSLNAPLGDVGSGAAPIDVEASVAVNADTSGAAGGDIFIDAGSSGNLPLGYLNAGTTTATVTLTATGSITDGNTDAANAGDTAGMNIRATNAAITAGDAIGVVGTDIFGASNGGTNNALETLVTTYDGAAASNASATINILDFGSPAFTTVLDAGTAAAGSAIISVTGALDVATSVDFADTGDSAGFIATGAITTPAALTVDQDLLLDGADLTDGTGDIDAITATRALIASDSAETFAATTITTLDTSSAGFASSLTYTLNSTALTLSDLDGDGTSVNSGGAFAATANGEITIDDAVTSGGGVTIDGNTNVLDVNANITASGTLTLTDTSDLQLAGGVVIDAQAGNAELNTAVTTTTLDGAGTVTVQTTAIDADVNLGAVTAAGLQGLTVSATDAANLNSTITLSGGDLSVSVDSNDSAATTLTVTNAISGVGNVILSGGATADDVIDINQSITAAGGITAQNSSDVQILGGSTIEAQGGNVDINNNVTLVSLGNVGTAIIQTTTADSDVELGPLVSAGDNLTIVSTNQATLDTINMGGGDLDVTVDSNDNGAVTLAVQNISNVGNVTLTASGVAGGDIIDVNQSITAAGFITIEETQEVQILGGATLEAQGGAVNIDTNVGGITLDGTTGTVVVTTTTAGADNNVSLADLASNGDGLTVTSEGNAVLGTLAMGGGNLDVQIDADNDNAGLTLLIDDAITNAGNILLHGDGTSFNEIIDIDQSITAGGSLAINDAATVDVAGDLALEGAGVNIQSNITAINLSGANGELVTITSTGDANTIDTSAVTAGANVNLTMASDGGLTLAGTIDINTGAFSATVDADNDGVGTDTLLVSMAPTAGSITLSGGGTGTGDVIDVDADLTSTAGGITIRNAADVQLDASAARALTSTGGDIDISQSVAAITLNNGASTVTLDANTDTNVLLGPVVDDGAGGTAADLVINAEGGVTLSTVDLNDTAQGDLTVNIDNNANGAESLTLNGNIQNVAIAAFNGASGGTPDEVFNVNAGITSSGAMSFTDAATVNLAGDIVLQGVNVDIENGGGNGITGIVLTGGSATTVQVISTGDGNTVSLAPVTASSNGSLTLQSDGNLAVNGAINLGTGALNAQVDADVDTDQTLTVAATIAAGTVTLGGGTDGTDDTIDVNANVTASTGALTVQNALAVDLAANVALQGDSVAASTQIGTVDLSGAGTNTVASTTGDVTLGVVTDSAAANLTVSSAANATLSAVTMDVGGAGVLLVTADANDDTVGATLTLGGAVNVTGATTLSGGATVDDLIDINANVTAGGALTLQNAAADLDANIDLTGLSVAADTATNALSGINLSGAGTNTITGTGGDVSLAPITDTADANLVVTATGNTTLDAITLDDGAASTATLSADSDNNSVSALTLNGVVGVDGAVSLAGSATADDLIDVNANVTAGGALTATNAATLDLAANVNLMGASVTANAAGGVALINLSGTGTNTITSTAGDVDVTAIGDTGDASLVISSTGNVTTAVITLDDAGATGGAVTITADDDDNTAAATLLAAGAITADGAVTLAGGIDNDDAIDIDANVTAGGVLTISNGAADLAAAIALQGASVSAVTDLTINLSGVGTNTITSTTGDVTLGAVTDSAVANLTVSSAANATLAAITLDNGAGVLSVTADDDDNTAGAVLAANGAIAVGGTATLSGGTDNDDLLDINAAVTAGGALTLQNGTADLAMGVNLTGASVAADTTTNQLAGIDLSGAGTNTITSTTGDTNLAPVTDSADASLVVSSEGNVTLASVVLDDAGATNGTVTVTADSGDDSVGVTLTTNGMVMADGAVAFSGGATVDDLMDINGNVTSGAALTLSNTAGIDLAANINLTGASVTADGTTNATGINLSGAGTNMVTATAGDVGLAPVADTADASLVVSATGNVTLAAITLDDAGATNGAVTVTADDDDNTAAATLTLNGVVDADGAIMLAGGTDNDDIVDVNQNITSDSALTITNAANVDVAAAAVLLQGASVSIATDITAITLSGAATYAITSTNGDVDLGPVVDTAAANLNVSSEANTTLAGVVFDDGGAGVLNVTTDDDDDTAGATLAVNGLVNVTGAATFLGGVGSDDTIDVNADITSAAALTLNTAGSLDLAGGVTVTGAGVEAQTGVTGILLSGAAGTTVTVISTGDANTMVLAPVAVSDNGNLTLLSDGDITLAGGIDLGTGALIGQVDAEATPDSNQTLTVSTAISAGTITLGGGTDGTDDTIDVNANVTATTGALTIQNALAVDLASNVALQGGSVAASTQIGTIDLSGFGTNIVTSTTGDVTLGAVTDSAAASLTISSAANATLSAVTMDVGGAGVLLVTADANDDTVGATLTLGGAVNVTGATTLSGGATVDDLIDINANVTAGGALTLQNAAADLDANIDLTGLSVAADTATNALSGINLSGAGTNTITGTGGDVSLAPITDTADANLVVTATGNTTLDAITLDDGAASTATLSADSDNNSVSTLTLNGVVGVDGAVSLAGSATADDLIDVNANVTAGGALTATNAATLDLAANVNLMGASVTANAAGGVALINLSGTGTNTITSTAGDVDVTAIGDTGDASLVISSTGNVTTAVITLDDAGATGGAVTITADDDDNTAAATLLAAGAITADGAVTLAGGIDNDDAIDIDANVTAGGVLTISNGAADLAAAIALQGASVSAVTDLTINLSGVGTNTITSTTGDVTLGAVTDSAVANLTVSSAANATLAAITLDNGAGVLSVTADDDDNTAGAVLAANGAIAVGGTATLSGGTDNDDLLDINAAVTAGGALTLQNGTADLAMGVNLTGASVAADTTTNQLAGIDLSGAGTNTITSTTGDTNLAPVTDSADASLVVSSEGNVTLASVVLDDAGATNGTVTVTADSGDDSVGVTLTTNGMVMADGAVAFSGGATVDDLMDINGNVTSGAALTLSNTAGIDLAANINLTGASVTADGTTNATGINLSGAGTNMVTATAGDVGLAPVADTADASLVVSATGNVTLAAITLDDAGATNGAVTVTADDDDDTAAATLTLNGVVDADGAIMLAGGTDNDDIVDVNQNITSDSALTITNAANVDVAAAAVLLQGSSVDIWSDVTTVTLSGAATNVVTSTAGNVNLSPVVDTAAANLTINSAADVILAGVVLDFGGAGALTINLDTNADGANLLDANGDITANTISVTGTAASGTETVSLAADVDLTATTGGISLAAADNISEITLDGAGTNIVTATGDGDVTLAPVTDTAAANLTVNGEGNVTLAGITLDFGGAGVVSVTGDSDSDGVTTLAVNGAIGATGAITLASGDADDTIDINAGITSTGGSVTISNSADVRVTNVTIDAQGGDLSIDGGITLDAGGAGTAVLQTSVADNDVTVAVINNTAGEGVTISSTGGATLGGAINLTNGGNGDLTVAVDSDDDAGVMETLAINNTVNAGNVVLTAGNVNSMSNITQAAVITADTLTATATNGITLTQNNVVPVVSLTNRNGGNVDYNSDLTVPAVPLTISGSNSFATGSFTAVEATQGMTVAAAGVSTDAGAIALTTTAAAQLLTVGGAVQSNQPTATGANITLTADDMAIGAAVNAGTAGTVTLAQVTTTDAIDLGALTDATANSLDLSSAELTLITAPRLLIGSPTAGAITVSSDVSILNVTTTHLTNNNTVTGTAGGIIAHDVAISAGGTVNISDTDSNIDNLAIAAAGFDVTFTNEVDGFEVDTVDGVSGVTGANITLSTGGNMQMVRGITATANVSATAAGDIIQDAGIAVTTSGGSVTYVADSDDSSTGAITMGVDATIETGGTAGENVSLTAGTAAGGQDITLANLDAGADGNVTVQTFAGAIRDDDRDSSVITGDNITLTANGDIGSAAKLTVEGNKSAALEITTVGLTGISATSATGNVMLMAVDSALFDPETFLTGLAGTGMSAGTEDQLFVGALDGAISVNTAIDLTASNNDLMLFTGGEGRDITINTGITLNRDPLDTTMQRLLKLQASGNITHTDASAAGRLVAYEVEASAPNGSITLFTGTDLLEGVGGVDENIEITNDTPVNSRFTDNNGNPTTRLLEEIVTAGTGNITIVNNGSLTIDKNVKTTGTGDISITANSPLFVESQVSAGGAVDLISGGDADVDGVYIINGGTVQSNSVTGAADGSIEVTSANKIVLDATAVLSTLAAGANGLITLTADSNTDVSGSGAGEVTMASGARLTSAGGAPITVTAGGAIALAELNAGLVAAADVVVNARGGAITDANAGSINIVGNDVTLTGGAGGIDTDLTAAGVLTATSSAANGDINVNAQFGGISLATADAGSGNVTLVAENGGISDSNGDGTNNVTGSVVTLNADGAINADVEAATSLSAIVQNAAAVAQNGAITLRSTGNMALASVGAGTGPVSLTSGGAITDTNGATVNIIAGPVSLMATGGGIDADVDATDLVNATSTSAGGAIDLANTTGNIALGTVSSNAGNITLTAATGNMTASGVTSSGGDIAATSTVGSLDLDGVDAGAGNVTLTSATTLAGTVAGNVLTATAGGNIGSGSASLNTTVTTLNATSTGGGIWASESDGLDVQTLSSAGMIDLSAGGDLTVVPATGAGAASIITTGGNLSLGGLTTTGAVTLASTGTLTASNVVTGAAATVSVNGGGDTTLSAVTGGATTVASGGTLDTTGGALTTAALSLTSVGDMTLGGATSTASVTASSGGALSATDAAGIVAATDITATAATTLTASNLTGSGAVALTGNNGAVAVTNVTTTGSVGLTATAGTLAASNVTTGATSAVNVSATGATTLTTLTGGAVTATSGGTLDVASLTAGGTTRLTSGDTLTVTTLAAGANQLALVSAAGAVLSGLTAGETTLDANGGAVSVTNLTATGPVALDGTGDMTLTTVSSTGSLAAITTGGTLGVTSLTAGGASRLTSTGELTVTTLAAGTNALTMESGAGATLSGVTAGETSLDSNGGVVTASNINTGTAALTLDAAGNTTLSTVTSGATSVVSGGTLVTTGGVLTTGTLGLTSAGNMTVGAVTSSGAVTASAGGAFDASNAASITAATDIVVTAATTLVATNLDGAGRVSLTANNGAMTVTDVATSGAVDMTAVAGDLSATNVVTGAASSVRTSSSGNTTLATLTGGATTVASGGTLGVTNLTAGGATSLQSEGDMTVATANVTGSLSMDTGGALTSDDVQASGAIVAVVDGVLTVSGLRGSDAVTLALGEDLIDTNTSGSPTITGTTLTITGGKAVVGLDTAVTGLDLDTAATSIDNTGSLDVSDSTVTGDLRLTSTGSITLGNLNAAGQDVFLLSGSGQILDGNGDALNVTASELDLVAAAVNGVETAVSSLRVLASSIVTVSNTGTLTVTQAATSGLLTLTNDGALTLQQVAAGTADITAPDISVGNVVADNSVIFNATGRVTDTNGSAENVRATSLEIAGGASVEGLETRVSSLALATGDTTISNLFELVLQDSVVTGDLNLTNENTLTFGELFVDGNADINVLSGNVVLGHAQLTGTLAIFADGSLLDGNGTSVNITSVMGTALSGGGVVGTIADPLEVAVGGDLSLAPTGAAGYVSSHINGVINGFTLIDDAVPGFVIQNAQAIGGGNYDLVAAPLAGELRLLDGGMGFEYNFMFEGIGNSLYPTDSVSTEIRYGTEGETDILDIEDILSMPMTTIDFDKWLDQKVEEAIVRLAVR